MPRQLAIVICLIAAACSATGPDPRPRESGFATRGGVADPYEDGKRHLTAGRYDLAAQRFGQALANDRRSIDALNGLAVAYTRLGRFDIAQTYFERALQVDATSGLTLNNYGWSLIEQGRLRDAKPFLEQALHRAADTDVPVVAGNLERMGHARPPVLIAALESGSRPGDEPRHRLIRLASNVYRLETTTGPVETPEPASLAHDAPSLEVVVGQSSAAAASLEQPRWRAETTPDAPVMTGRVGVAGSAQSSAERYQAAEPALDPFVDQVRPDPVLESEAAAILPGERT